MAFVNLFTSPAGLSVRFSLLRVLCIAAFVTCVADITHIASVYKNLNFDGASAKDIAAFVVVFAVSPITLIHHTTNSFGPKLSLPGCLDLFFVTVELTGLIIRGIFAQSSIYYSWPQPESYLIIAYIATLCSITSLLALTVVRASDFIRSGRRSWLQRYDFTRPRASSASTIIRPSALSVLTGRALWKAHFIGETNWIIVCRAIISIVIVTGVILFATWNIVFQPIQEMWLIPLGVLRSSMLPPNAVSEGDSGFNLFLTNVQLRPDRKRDNATIRDATFVDAITVKALWPLSPVAEPCSFVKLKGSGLGYISTNNFSATARSRYLYGSIVGFHCPPKVLDDSEDRQQRSLPYRVYIHPDFLVSVNFSRLGIPLELGEEGPENIIGVLLGLTNETNIVLHNTPPTSLVPGVNLVGTTKVVVRQQLDSTVGALFMDNLNTFMLAEITQLWADPRPLSSKLLPTGPDIATIRIRTQAGMGDWKIVQDYRDMTVLNGFASVGGLWTFLEGVFAALFGSSILKILLGLKPLSFFGTAHSLQQKQIREACIAEYPQIEHDIAAPDRSRGLLRMICDHLLDVDFLAPPELPAERHQASTASNETRVGDIELTPTEQVKLLDEKSSLLEYNEESPRQSKL